MTRSTRIWVVWVAIGFVIVVGLAIMMALVSGVLFGTRTAAAATRDVQIGTALSGEKRVTELEPINKIWGVRRVEVTTSEVAPLTTAARTITERNRTERASSCIYFRPTGTDVACVWQEVYWAWRYNYDLHRASWIDVNWSKWTWRSNAPLNPWSFKSWDGSRLTSGEIASAGENLQWRERIVWATFESCLPLYGCQATRQQSVGQHIRNYDGGHYRVL